MCVIKTNVIVSNLEWSHDFLKDEIMTNKQNYLKKKLRILNSL